MQYTELNTYKSFSQLVESIINKINTTMNCVKIGKIISFDKTNQTASVQILHTKNSNYNTFQTKENGYPLLCNVPVVILSGGSANITFPIKEGDECLVLFCDYMIDNWWISGGVSSSDFPRHHDISDAIAVVGLKSLPKSIQNYSDYLRLSYNGSNYIEVKDGSVDINTPVVNCSQDVAVTKDLTAEKATAELHDTRGATGTFTDSGFGSSGLKLTIVDGIITKIE